MTPTEDLINWHKAIKVMPGTMSKIAEDIKKISVKVNTVSTGFD